MITIKKSPTADTRTCDFANTPKDVLLNSSWQHIEDVREALEFFKTAMSNAQTAHDFDKISEIDAFHSDFITGFKKDSWWITHRALHRHHLNYENGIPANVNLVDVIEYICDCVMAGMARSGSVYDINLDDALLQRAFQNTVELLKKNVEVKPCS